MLHVEQKSIRKRLWIAIPFFGRVWDFNIQTVIIKNGFDIIWRYFAVGRNQLLAAEPYGRVFGLSFSGT